MGWPVGYAAASARGCDHELDSVRQDQWADPYAYLKDVLEQLPTQKASSYPASVR
jgi:hypothetical protein